MSLAIAALIVAIVVLPAPLLAIVIRGIDEDHAAWTR
jgi:hypothetical protein